MDKKICNPFRAYHDGLEWGFAYGNLFNQKDLIRMFAESTTLDVINHVDQCKGVYPVIEIKQSIIDSLATKELVEVMINQASLDLQTDYNSKINTKLNKDWAEPTDNFIEGDVKVTPINASSLNIHKKKISSDGSKQVNEYDVNVDVSGGLNLSYLQSSDQKRLDISLHSTSSTGTYLGVFNDNTAFQTYLSGSHPAFQQGDYCKINNFIPTGTSASTPAELIYNPNTTGQTFEHWDEFYIPAGVTSWGAITGTLSNQHDLETALNDVRAGIDTKANYTKTTSDTTYTSIGTNGTTGSNDLLIQSYNAGGQNHLREVFNNTAYNITRNEQDFLTPVTTTNKGLSQGDVYEHTIYVRYRSSIGDYGLTGSWTILNRSATPFTAQTLDNLYKTGGVFAINIGFKYMGNPNYWFTNVAYESGVFNFYYTSSSDTEVTYTMTESVFLSVFANVQDHVRKVLA